MKYYIEEEFVDGFNWGHIQYWIVDEIGNRMPGWFISESAARDCLDRLEELNG